MNNKPKGNYKTNLLGNHRPKVFDEQWVQLIGIPTVEKLIDKFLRLYVETRNEQGNKEQIVNPELDEIVFYNGKGGLFTYLYSETGGISIDTFKKLINDSKDFSAIVSTYLEIARNAYIFWLHVTKNKVLPQAVSCVLLNAYNQRLSDKETKIIINNGDKGLTEKEHIELANIVTGKA